MYWAQSLRGRERGLTCMGLNMDMVTWPFYFVSVDYDLITANAGQFYSTAAAAAGGAAAAASRCRRAPPLKIGAASPSLENFRTFLDRGAAATFSDVFGRLRAYSFAAAVAI